MVARHPDRYQPSPDNGGHLNHLLLKAVEFQNQGRQPLVPQEAKRNAYALFGAYKQSPLANETYERAERILTGQRDKRPDNFMRELAGKLLADMGYLWLCAQTSEGTTYLSEARTLVIFKQLFPHRARVHYYFGDTLDGISVPDSLGVRITPGNRARIIDVVEITASNKNLEGSATGFVRARERFPELYAPDARLLFVVPRGLDASIERTADVRLSYLPFGFSQLRRFVDEFANRFQPAPGAPLLRDLANHA